MCYSQPTTFFPLQRGSKHTCVQQQDLCHHISIMLLNSSSHNHSPKWHGPPVEVVRAGSWPVAVSVTFLYARIKLGSTILQLHPCCIPCCRYQSRGLFLDPPTCGLSHGQWRVQLPRDLQDHARHEGQEMRINFDTRQEVFGNRGDMQSMYAAFIAQAMERYESADSTGVAGSEAARRLASCIMEPVIQVPILFA